MTKRQIKKAIVKFRTGRRLTWREARSVRVQRAIAAAHICAVFPAWIDEFAKELRCRSAELHVAFARFQQHAETVLAEVRAKRSG